MNTLKKSAALVIAFMLIFTMCMIPVSAAETISGGTTLYLKPNSNWLKDSARFAMYVYNSSGNDWASMTDDDGDGYYEGTVPDGSWTNVIFCRMDGSSTANGWSTKWNQTSDLTVSSGTNCYIVADSTWDKGGGQWVAYTPGEEPSTVETTAPSYKYTVAGDTGLCGVSWEAASEANAMSDDDGDGVYEITYSNVAAGTYSFKVTDGTWNNSWGDGSGNYSFTLNSTADVTIKFTESTYAIEVESDGLGEFVLNHMTVIGDKGLIGADWDATSELGVMTQGDDGVWTLTVTGVAAGTYGYKFVANESKTYNWTVEGYFDSSDNSSITIDSDDSSVTFTIDVSGYDFSTSTGDVTASATVESPEETTAATEATEVTEATEESTEATEVTEESTEESTEATEVTEVTTAEETTVTDSGAFLTVTSTSNLFPTQTAEFDEGTNQVTVTYTIKADKDILNYQWSLYYDPDVLSPNSTLNTTSTVFPTGSGMAINLVGSGGSDHEDMKSIKANASSLKLMDITTDTTVFATIVFDVVTEESASTTLYMDMEYSMLSKLASNGYTDADEEVCIVNGNGVNESAIEELNVVTGTEIEATDATEPSTEATEATDATEPATDPADESVTIKFAAPTSSASRYNWTSPVLFYGSTQSMDSVEMLEMTATDDVYYTADVGSSSLLTTTGWTVYELEVSAEQAEAIDAAKFVGFATSDGVNRTTLVSGSNVLKAGIDSYSSTYGSTASSITDLDGKTFVIKDAAYGEKSSVSYVGYWTSSYVTVMAAAPLASTSYSTWDAVELYYGDEKTFDSMSKVTMINTGETTKVSSLDSEMSIKTGRWKIFAVTLDKATTEAVESAAYVGFSKAEAINRTSILKNVLTAKTDEHDGTYNTAARTLEELEGQLFVIKGMTSKSTSSVATYTGEWETESVYTQGNDDTVTIYFAAPKGVKEYADWDTGVQLYYSSESVYTNAARLDMTKLDETTSVTVDSEQLSTLVSGDWDVYSLTLTVDQINEIDSCQRVGFVKTGSYNRTSYAGYRNICKASMMDGETAYSGVKESIERFDGYMFVINSCYTSTAETVTYTGSWIVK